MDDIDKSKGIIHVYDYNSILSDIIKIKNLNELILFLKYHQTQSYTLQTILIYLIERKCDLDIIKMIINVLDHVNYQTMEKKIPLFVAMKEQQFQVATTLLQNHADINFLNDCHENVLSYLFKSKTINAMQLLYLLKRGIHMNEQDNEGNTCLMNAIKYKDHHLIKIIFNHFFYNTDDIIDILFYYKSHKKHLIEFIEKKNQENKAKLQMNLKNRDNDTALILGCRYNNYEVVKNILQYGDIDINEKGEDSKTALIWAIYRENIDIIRLLLSYHADINTKDFYGMSPLSHACQSGNYTLVEFLLDQGADINIKDNSDLSSLVYSITNDNDKISKLLIDRGIDIHAVDHMGKIPLIWSSQSNNVPITEFLLDRGSDINHKDYRGTTSLMWACKQRNKFIVELLLKRGADIYLKDDNDKTCLMYSIVYGNNDIVKLLLSSGCDCNSKDKFGKSALFYAIEEDLDEIIEILLDHGANFFDCDHHQQNILEYIQDNNHKYIHESYMKRSINKSKT